ncbi:MAG: hypothetical protein AB8B53_08050 [Flavobacteriales bacterium]
MDQIKDDIQNIINYSHDFAEIMLNDGGEYYPFGATISPTGELTPVGYNDEETDNPQSQKVIDQLRSTFDDQLKSGEIRAYAITFDVKVSINEDGDKSDAILIDITHRNDDQIPQYYFPYNWIDNELKFGKSFGMKK